MTFVLKYSPFFFFKYVIWFFRNLHFQKNVHMMLTVIMFVDPSHLQMVMNSDSLLDIIPYKFFNFYNFLKLLLLYYFSLHPIWQSRVPILWSISCVMGWRLSSGRYGCDDLSKTRERAVGLLFLRRAFFPIAGCWSCGSGLNLPAGGLLYTGRHSERKSAY